MGPRPFLLAAVTPVDVDWPRPAPLPCAINPCAARPAGWLGEPPPPPRRQLGCQLARAPPRPAWVSARPGACPPSQHKAALWGPPGVGWGPGGEWKIS